MTKYLPLALATAAIIATQIACAFAVVKSRDVTLFVDDIDQIVYDGQVVRADLRRAWVNEGQTETELVGRLVLTKDATLRLHNDLAQILAARRSVEPGI